MWWVAGYAAGGAALLYTLYKWLIPGAVQYHGGLALIWHDVIVEWILDTLTQSTRPQVGLHRAAILTPTAVSSSSSKWRTLACSYAMRQLESSGCPGGTFASYLSRASSVYTQRRQLSPEHGVTFLIFLVS